MTSQGGHLPQIVQVEPRYRREAFSLFGGGQRESSVWHLDGIPWYEVPPPQRRGHEHVAQTVGLFGLFDEIRRCPCSAIRDARSYRWVNLEERFAPTRDRRKWQRLLERVLGDAL